MKPVDKTLPLWFAQTEKEASPPRFTFVESFGVKEVAAAMEDVKSRLTMKTEALV
jgi:hypothetical protein